MTKTLHLIHLGCRVNQYELAAMGELLKIHGIISLSSKKSPPDICLINTCCVTKRASMQSRQAVRHSIRQFPTAKIIVTGCYAQLDPVTLAKIPGVSGILGNTHKEKIVSFTKDVLANSALQKLYSDVKEIDIFQELPPDCSGNRTRPIVKIQDGCNAFCSYCIVPSVRGKSRSLPIASVLDQVNQLAKKGFAEIVLSGIHLGQYGLDLTPKINLETLLQKLLSTDIPRIRLSSIDPTELTENMISIIAQNKKFCRHLHIPLQSGDNTILRKMNRAYTRDFFFQKINEVHQRIPGVAIGVDVIVGFPGETQEAFKTTFSLLEELPVSYLHVFPYSKRPDTPAALLPDTISSQKMKERTQKLRTLSVLKQEKFLNRFIGQKLDVILESCKDEKYLQGTSDNYISVRTKCSKENLHKRITVEISRIKGKIAIGEKI